MSHERCSWAYLESKSVPSQDTLLYIYRFAKVFCFRETDSQKRKGNGSSSKGRCPFRAGVLSGKTKGYNVYNLLRYSFCESYGVLFCSPGGRSLASIDPQHGAVSRVTVGGFLSHPGSVVASYQSAMGPGPKVKSYL